MSLRGRIGGGSKSSAPPTNNYTALPPLPPKQPLVKQRTNNSNIQNPPISITTTKGSSSAHSSFPSSHTPRNLAAQQSLQQQAGSSSNHPSSDHHSSHHQPQTHEDYVPLHLRHGSKSSVSSDPASAGATSTGSLSLRTSAHSSASIPTPTAHTAAQVSAAGAGHQSNQGYITTPTPTPLSAPHSSAPYNLNPISVHKTPPGEAKVDSTQAFSPFSPMGIDPGVKVVLRIRPFNRSELDEMMMAARDNANGPSTAFPFTSPAHGPNMTQTDIFSELSAHHVTAAPSSNSHLGSTQSGLRFNFDLIVSPSHPQSAMFTNVALPMLNACLQGYNSTIFCYGQSGSGKSYTMDCSVRKPCQQGSGGTAVSNAELLEQEGIIPRSLRHVYGQLNQFEAMGGPATNFQWQTYCSLLEVYNDKVYDLLDSQGGTKAISSQDVEKQGKLISIRSFGESQQLLTLGLKNRKVAATLLNAQSSRSHLVFILYISTTHVNADGTTVIHNSKLTLIDLAGSERIRKSGVLTESLGGNSEQLDEATHINKSLSCLSNVINKINYNNETRSSNFVPYRDSSLTRILRDSLGGNSLTCVIACISPSRVQEQETLSTLRFAESVRKVKNRIALNEIKQLDQTRGGGDFGVSQAEWERLNALAQTQHRQGQLAVQQQAQLAQVFEQIAQQRNRLQDVVRGIRELAANEEDLGQLQEFINQFDFSPSLALPAETHSALTSSLAVFAVPGSTEPVATVPIPHDPSEVVRDIKATLERLHQETVEAIEEGTAQPDDATPGSTRGSTQSVFTLEFKLTQIQQEYSNLQEIYSVELRDKAAMATELETTTGLLEEARAQVATQAETIDRLEASVDGLNADMTEMERDHRDTVDGLTQDHSETIETMIADHQNQIGLLTSEHQAELTLKQTMFQASLDQVQRNLRAEQARVAELSSALHDEETWRQRLEAELAEERAQHQALEQQHNLLRDHSEIETARANSAEQTVAMHEVRIDKLARKLQQVVGERNEVREKCVALEEKYTIYLQKCAQKIQTLKADHETNLQHLQDLHQKYTDDLQNQHQARIAENDCRIEQLETELGQQTALTAQLQHQLGDERALRVELQTVYANLQDKFTKQSALLQSTDKECTSRGEQIATLKAELGAKSTEYESLFQLNLSLSSHNNDAQKIKMQEILRERLRVAETKLRETQQSYDQLHQRHSLLAQRNRLGPAMTGAGATPAPIITTPTATSAGVPPVTATTAPIATTTSATAAPTAAHVPQPLTTGSTVAPASTIAALPPVPAAVVINGAAPLPPTAATTPAAAPAVSITQQPSHPLPVLTSSSQSIHRSSSRHITDDSVSQTPTPEDTTGQPEEPVAAKGGRSSIGTMGPALAPAEPPTILPGLPVPVQRPLGLGMSTVLPQRSLKHKQQYQHKK